MKQLLKIKLIKYYRRNGYIRIPDDNLRKLKGHNYKKGYEVRLVANDEKELFEINSLLHKSGFKVGKPFQKGSQFVLPIYGKEAVEKFQNSLENIKGDRKGSKLMKNE